MSTLTSQIKPGRVAPNQIKETGFGIPLIVRKEHSIIDKPARRRNRQPQPTIIFKSPLSSLPHPIQRFDTNGDGVLDEAEKIIGRRIMTEMFLENHERDIHLYGQGLAQKVRGARANVLRVKEDGGRFVFAEGATTTVILFATVGRTVPGRGVEVEVCAAVYLFPFYFAILAGWKPAVRNPSCPS